MVVWVVQSVPYGVMLNYANTSIEGVFNTFKKAQERALEIVKRDIKFNNYKVNKYEFDNFENHFKIYEDISIDVFADKDENYNEYYTLSIISKVVE